MSNIYFTELAGEKTEGSNVSRGDGLVAHDEYRDRGKVRGRSRRE